MNKRTILRFNYTGEIWPVVEKWANENGYSQLESEGHEKLYQKGVGFLVTPPMLKVAHENQETIVEAWIRTNLFMRLIFYFILPSEMGIESGGFRLALPRRTARKAVNALLAQLGQPPIL
jgi:hypothetical protein